MALLSGSERQELPPLPDLLTREAARTTMAQSLALKPNQGDSALDLWLKC